LRPILTVFAYTDLEIKIFGGTLKLTEVVMSMVKEIEEVPWLLEEEKYLYVCFILNSFLLYFSTVVLTILSTINIEIDQRLHIRNYN
jgi:hypothetical protein